MKPWSRSTSRPCSPGDVVGIGIHTGNALRGYEIGTAARAKGAVVVYGGIHATLYPEEAQSLGGAHAVVKGDGDQIWPVVLDDAVRGTLQPIYEAGRIDADQFVPARWDLLPEGPLHVGLGPDRPRLPQALLVLLGLAHRRPETAAARRRCGRRRNRGSPPAGLPVRGACRRQLLPGDPDRSRDGRAPGQYRPASSSCGRCVRSDSS